MEDEVVELEVKHKMMLFHKSSNKTQVAAKDAMVRVASQHEDIINMMNEVLKAADNEEPEGKDQAKFKEWKSRYAAELLLLQAMDEVAAGAGSGACVWAQLGALAFLGTA